MAASLDLGTWVFGATRTGSPSANELDVKADDLANQIERQAKGTQATMDRMGDVIVNDYAKLQAAGTNALCNPSDPSCPAGWAFTRDDRDEASAAIQRGIERTTYDRLFPLGYRTYELRDDTSNQLPVFRPAAPNIGTYGCRTYSPWHRAPDKGLVSAVSAGILEPRTGNMNYTTYVFAQAAGANDHEGTFPPATMLHRMFDPLPLRLNRPRRRRPRHVAPRLRARSRHDVLGRRQGERGKPLRLGVPQPMTRCGRPGTGRPQLTR